MNAVTGPAAPPPAAPAWDLLVVLLGAPHVDDQVSTALTWADVAAAGGARVQVWTCGHATGLSQAVLGDVKPPSVLDRDRVDPTSAAWLAAFVARHGDRARWLVCRYCSEERGSSEHVAAARVRPSAAFVRHVRESAKTVVVGVS